MPERKRVLVVDDEPGVLRFVKAILSRAGYDVLTTSNGKDALCLVESDVPDLMLLDVLMKPVNGFEVLKKLRAFSQIPVIVFTARNDVLDASFKEGADGFLSKPFKPGDLLSKINEVTNNKEEPGKLPSSSEES